METLTTQQMIEKLEKELADLRDKARIEKEEAFKKVESKRKSEFDEIKKSIQDYNKKYNERVVIGIGRDTKTAESLFFDFFPWLRGE